MMTAGQYNVSYAQVAAMQAAGAQDIKTELWAASRADLLLATTTLVIVSTGSSVFTTNPDFDHEYTLTVYDGSIRDRAQTRTSSSITLAAGDSAADSAYVGYTVFDLTTAQYAQITNYVSATKVASITQTWDATTTAIDYLIAQFKWEMTRDDDSSRVMTPQRPAYYQITGPTVWVRPSPDKVYPILMSYAPNLTMIDEVSSIFVAWLKQRVALLKQGIRVQTMLLYDDDRYSAELQRWEQMKQAYGAQNPTSGQIQRHR
jgi:hypothetical protein